MLKHLNTSVATALVLVGLGQTPATAQEIVLQWQSDNLTEAQFEPIWRDMIAEFEAERPNITIEPVIVARKDGWTKFVTAAQARQAPCLVSVTELHTAADNGYLMSLEKFWNAEPEEWRQAWSEQTLEGGRWNGELFGLPVWGGIYAEIYNRDLVEAAGLDPSNPPVTWEDYREWATALTGPNQWATAVLGGPTDTTARVLLTWIYSNGGEPFNEDMTEATFAKDPKSLEAIKFYLSLAEEGLAAPGGTTTNYLEQTNMFAQGRIATMRTAYWAIAKVIGDNPNMEGKMFVAPNPRNIDQPAPTVATMNTASISSNCEYPEEAWEFIKFESEPKWAIARARSANWVPLRSDLLDDPEITSDPQLAKFLEIGSTARTYPPRHPAWADIAGTDIVDAVQAALLAPDNVDAIFTELDAKVTRKLQEQ